jgi:cell division protein ZapA
MAEKNTIKVMIDGKSFSIGGYESTDYLEHVAFYINNKINEMKGLPGYNRQSPDMKTILLALNVADDYYKAKTRADALEEDIESKDEEWYSVKQDLANARVRIHELEQALARAQAGRFDPSVPLADGAVEPIVSPVEHESAGSAAGKHESAAPMAKSEQSETEESSTSKSNEKYLKRSRRYAKNNA